MATEKENAKDLNITLKLVDALGRQAEQTEDPELKKILLVSSCEIIDRLLQMHEVSKAA